MKPLGLGRFGGFGWFAAPALLLLLWHIAPLALGRETLYLRDVLNTHLPMKHAEAESLRAGTLPLVDIYRAGGQPLLGNPNAVPLYPDNLLYLIAPTLWALNAHFWLHWLVALLAMAWLARAYGLGRESAFAAGIFYALCGYFVSQLQFYNLVAIVALAPAMCAAALRLADSGRLRYAAAGGALWALLLFGGEPIQAAYALALAAAAFLFARPNWNASAKLALGLAAGTLVAAPQLVETWRILALSFRGHAGFSDAATGIASFDPRQAAEWLLPFLFGRPDRLGAAQFWGHEFYTGTPALFFTLYPGIAALALVAASLGARGRAVAFAWFACAVGLFLALGRFHPLTNILLSVGGWLRFPVKFFLPVAIGGALLAGIGFQRAFLELEPRARRAARALLGGLALFYLGVWALLTLRAQSVTARLREWIPAEFPDSMVNGERLRWAGLCLFSLVALAAFALALRLGAHRQRIGGALLLALHTGSQLYFLTPAMATDEAAPYRQPSPLLEQIPATAKSAHGSFSDLFGRFSIRSADFPDTNAYWLERRAFAELYPFAGALWGRRFEFNVAPERLDAFLTRMAHAAVEQNPDVDRLRLLKAWGVSRLILNRDLGPEHAERARLLLRRESFGRAVYVYEILGAAPEVSFAGTVLHAPDLLVTFRMLSRDEFDPRTSAVIQGKGPPSAGAGGELLSFAAGPESLEAAVAARSAGVLVWQRSHLPIYRATLNGVEAPIVFANFYRMGVEIPSPGNHQVRIWADRRPLHRALAAAAVGAFALLTLLILDLGGRRKQGMASAEVARSPAMGPGS